MALRDRLERIRSAAGTVRPIQLPVRQSSGNNEAVLPEGWTRVAPCVWKRGQVRTSGVSGGTQDQEFLQCPEGRASGHVPAPPDRDVPCSPGYRKQSPTYVETDLAIFSRRLAGTIVAPKNCLFFDLETTGLSGGAGTVAFLAAFGRYTDDRSFAVTQYFMTDYPGETDFLACIAAEMLSLPVIVTYNGATFDIPLLRVRRTMNDMLPMEPTTHVDVLHAARRLWRRTLNDCSLGSLEAKILGLRREGDIPGSRIPEVWFSFLKAGSDDRLAGVFDHNAQDIVSLAELHGVVIDVASFGGRWPHLDYLGVAELQGRLDPAMAERTLRSLVDHGSMNAVRPLMRLLGRQGRREERQSLVPLLPDDAAGLYLKSLYAARVGQDQGMARLLAMKAAEAAPPDSVIAARARKRLARLDRLTHT